MDAGEPQPEASMPLLRSRRHLLTAGLVSLSLAGVAAVPASASDYPSQIEHNFLSSCQKSAVKAGSAKTHAKRYCSAVLSCLEDKLTLKQFAAADTAARKGRKSKYDKVVAGCVKKANAAS